MNALQRHLLVSCAKRSSDGVTRQRAQLRLKARGVDLSVQKVSMLLNQLEVMGMLEKKNRQYRNLESGHQTKSVGRKTYYLTKAGLEVIKQSTA